MRQLRGIRLMCILLAALLTTALPDRAFAIGEPPPGMQAVTIDDVVKAWDQLDDVQHLVALEQIINVGETDLADRLLQTTKFEGVLVADAAALTAALRNRQQRPADAAAIAEKVLVAFPAHRRARFELGQAKFLIEDDASAREHFAIALNGADPQLEQVIRAFIDTMDKRKRWSAQVTVSATASTNISQGADNRIIYLNGLPFELDGSAVSQAGAAIWVGAAGGYTHPLASGVDLVSAVSANVKRFTEDTFNDSIVGASIGPRWSFGIGDVPVQFGLYLTGGYRWITDEPYAANVGGRVAILARPAPSDLLNLSFASEEKTFSRDWAAGDLSYQDGVNHSLTVSLDHDFADGFFVRALGSLERETPEADHLQYDMWRIGAGIGGALPMGFSAYAQATYSELDFDGISPGFDAARRDERFDASLNLANTDWAFVGLVPSAQYTYTRNASNVPIYDFDAHGITLTMTRDF